jgi:hypothetical protein
VSITVWVSGFIFRLEIQQSLSYGSDYFVIVFVQFGYGVYGFFGFGLVCGGVGLFGFLAAYQVFDGYAEGLGD